MEQDAGADIESEFTREVEVDTEHWFCKEAEGFVLEDVYLFAECILVYAYGMFAGYACTEGESKEWSYGAIGDKGAHLQEYGQG